MAETYIILSASSASLLAADVNKAIKDGYGPFGGVAFEPRVGAPALVQLGMFHQAMLRLR